MNIEEIMTYLPHRYPMLLVDRILELEPGKMCVGLKNVSINEQFFQGHYPQMPIMPGVLIVESMAQVGAMVIMTMPNKKGLIPVFGAMDDLKFRRPVVPGDQLITTAELIWFRSNIGRMKASSTVEGQLVATIEATFKLVRQGTD